MSTRGGFLSALLDFIKSLFGWKQKPPSPTPIPPSFPADNSDEPTQSITSKVLLVIFDPVMDQATGTRLSQQQRWSRVDELVNRYIADIVETSAGLASYQIVDRVELDEFPEKVDGFRYTPETYLDVIRRVNPPHMPHEVNYHALLSRFNILQRVADNELDEVWLFAFPHAGFYESIMGGAGAFWCNAPPLENTSSCPRRFVIMGFSYERKVGEMLEAFGHRCESIMERTFERTRGEDNLWHRFIRYDKIAPGKAEVGNIHFAPNSERDYDWNNPRMVLSRCDDWFNFPDFQNVVKQVNSAEWGNGDIRLHHKWWLKHFPKVAGRKNGIANNWWQYILDPNRVQI